MTIVGCAVKSETATVGRTGVTYERVVQVEFTDGFSCAGAVAITGQPLCKKYGEEHPDDPNSVVTAVKISDPTSDGDDPQAGYFDYAITFSPFDASFILDPLSRPPEIEWGTGGEDQTEVMYQDYDGNTVQNSAGDRYDPMPEWDVPGADVTISRYEADNPADMIQIFSKSTNAAPIWGQDTDTARMGKITATKVYENNVAYWKVKYPIYFTDKDGGWKLMLVDNGYRVTNADGDKVRHADASGAHSPVPILLDGEGAELADGEDPVIYPEEGYRRLPSVAWATLSLPNPFA